MKAEVYGTKTCAPCATVKKYLQAKGVPFTEIDATIHKNRARAYELSQALTVPVTVFYGGTAVIAVIVGWNPAKFAEVLA